MAIRLHRILALVGDLMRRPAVESTVLLMPECLLSVLAICAIESVAVEA